MKRSEERALLPGWRGKVRNFGQRYAGRMVHWLEQRQGTGSATGRFEIDSPIIVECFYDEPDLY